MATHSSVLAWRIPGTGEPGGLLRMGSHRVGHDWSDSSSSNAFSTVTKGLIMPCGHNFHSLRSDRKISTDFFFLLHSFTEDSFLLQILSTLACDIFLSSLSQELSAFHLKETLQGFSLAYLNCQHCDSCIWGPLLSKTRVMWTQALWYDNSWSENWAGTEWLAGRIHWTKEWATTKEGKTEWDSMRCHHTTQAGAWFKTDGLFVSGISGLLFLNCR